MVIYKFGGASVCDASSIKNVTEIIRGINQQVIVVISAMGKTTNKLEKIIDAYWHQTGEAASLIEQLRDWHVNLATELFGQQTGPAFDAIERLFAELYWCIEETQIRQYDYEYDQIAVFGELLSTAIVSAFLIQSGFDHVFADARGLIRSDDTYRDANVDWTETSRLINLQLQQLNGRSLLTQGFIAGTSENFSTTLGREGSDYSAAIFAYCANAAEVVIWKDVAGVFNADPHEFSEAVLIPALSYYDAIEQAYYGATIIHPKTIKPLQNKNIPLKVKSFVNPSLPGTLIAGDFLPETVPTYILKKNQLLLSISPVDFSFIAEDHLRDIFEMLHELKIKVNLMQNSALNFTVCMNNNPVVFDQLKILLEKKFRIRYNSGCILMTIRHYTNSLLERFTEGRDVLLEQRSRNTLQFVYR